MTSVEKDENVDGKGDHLVKAEIQFVEGDRVDVVVADTKARAGGGRWWRRKGIEQGAKDSHWGHC